MKKLALLVIVAFSLLAFGQSATVEGPPTDIVTGELPHHESPALCPLDKAGHPITPRTGYCWIDMGTPHTPVQLTDIVTVVARHADGKEFYRYSSPNLKTTGGIDLIASQLANTSAPAATSNYLALSADTGTPAAGDCAAGSSTCTLTGELNTNGMSRAQGTYAHSNGASTLTLTHTWTDSTAVTSNVQKAAIFNASSSGTMTFENTFTPVTLQIGDTLQVTWTITIS